jgi:hypothetical protein
MDKYRFSRGALVLAALLVLGPGVTFAQPARNANIWDWSNHEPVPSEVQKKEQAAGILPTPEQQQAEGRELESLYRSLIKAPRPNQSRSAPSNLIGRGRNETFGLNPPRAITATF